MMHSMEDYIFNYKDRIQKIRSMEKYGLLEKSYLSFSGGKDSVVVHHLLDLAFPDNKIPRVYFNTGIEYNDVVKFVKRLAAADHRIVIVNSKVNIKQMLNEVGYPFKSKEHSLYLSVYQHSGMGKSVTKYLNNPNPRYICNPRFRYQFTPDFQLKVSNKCCFKLKKEVAKEWVKKSGKTITITGMRKNESGLRLAMKGCTVFADDDCKELMKFHPLFPIEEWWEDMFIEDMGIKLCKLYSEPFNFKRTGCKGCPYSPDLQKQLDIMQLWLPNEYRQCEWIWEPVYSEYRRINYRLKSKKKQEETKD